MIQKTQNMKQVAKQNCYAKPIPMYGYLENSISDSLATFKLTSIHSV